MEGITLGVIIGASATLVSTLLTSSFNLIMAKVQYNRELKKTFIHKKTEAYLNVCKTISAIGLQDTPVLMSSSQEGLEWAKKSHKELNVLYMNECLWLDKNDCNNLESLQKDFVNFIFPEEDESSTELRMKCGKILQYCSEKTQELYVMNEKRKWWKLW